MTSSTISTKHLLATSRKPCAVIQRLHMDLNFSAELNGSQGLQVVSHFLSHEDAFVKDACARILRDPQLDGEKLLRQACSAIQRKIDGGTIKSVEHLVKSFLVILSRNARRDRIRLHKRTLGTLRRTDDPKAPRIPRNVVSLDAVSEPLDQQPSPPQQAMHNELGEAFSWEAIVPLGISAQMAWTWGHYKVTKGTTYGSLQFLAELVMLDTEGNVVGVPSPVMAQQNPTQVTRQVLGQIRSHIKLGCQQLRHRASQLGWAFDE